MKALILVDIQNDFLPGGNLAVPHGDEVVPVANRLIERFKGDGALVVATQDWHPADHKSFASRHAGHKIGDTIKLEGLDQYLWPDHCVQGGEGTEFAPGLNIDAADHVVQKGTDVTIDSYSGFFDNGHRKATGLGDYLKEQGVTEVTIIGLATDYCVKFTALDAAKLGFETTVVREGCRGVEINEGDCERAFEEMAKAGVKVE